MDDVKSIIIGTVIMVIIATAGISLMAEVNNENPIFLDNNTAKMTSINNTFNSVSSGLNEVSNSVNSTLSDEGETTGTFGFVDDLFKSVTSTFKTIGSSFGFLKDFVLNLDGWLPIPSWIGGFLVTILVIIIGFALIKAVMKV